LITRNNGGNDMTAMMIRPYEELARRASHGIEVSLLWSRFTNRVRVRVFDTRFDEDFELQVDGNRALGAYRRPFAFAAAEQTANTNVPTDTLAA
jgi:hypothetical protein